VPPAACPCDTRLVTPSHTLCRHICFPPSMSRTI